MGNTCASVHIAWGGTADDAGKAISRAYAKCGYERLKKTPPEGGKHVVLLAGGERHYVSVYDSTNAQLDNGELKDMALATSKILKTTAIFTSLYDSDKYEFIVFTNGRQVDLLLTDAENYSGPLKRLSDKSRATQWSNLFGETFTVDQIKQAIDKQTVFAEDTLAELCKLVGLSVSQPQMQYHDFAREPESITAQLYFAKKKAEQSAIPDGQISLTNIFDPQSSRMLLVYPASWPISIGTEKKATWLMLSNGAGFNDGTATIRVSGPDGLVLSTGFVNGNKFHNGQIVGELEPPPKDASREDVEKLFQLKNFAVLPGGTTSSGARLYTAEFPNLNIPSVTPERTTQILIVLQLDLAAQAAGEWEINVTLEPRSQTEYQHDLPAIRIAAVDQAWLPVVSGLNPKIAYDTSDLINIQPRGSIMLQELTYKQSRISDERCLDHFAIASNVAILKDDGQAALDACRSYLEAWLRPLAEHQQGEIRIHAEKRMTETAYVGKTKKTLPISAFFDDKTWKKIFDYGSNYQTALVTFFPIGAEYPIAGVGLQFSLEDTAKYNGTWKDHYEQQMADTLSTMRGRTFPKAAHSKTLHLFNWVINHADCYQRLGTSVGDMERQIDAFAAEHAPLQAWHGQSTWIPLFDQADEYQRTTYEESSVLNWFRGIAGIEGGLNDEKMSAQWCSNVLRMVTPRMWLCRNLIEQVDKTALDLVALVTEANGTYQISLRQGRALDELEIALLPILPVESSRIKVLAQISDATR